LQLILFFWYFKLGDSGDSTFHCPFSAFPLVYASLVISGCCLIKEEFSDPFEW
jgi:hypothetical protein